MPGIEVYKEGGDTEGEEKEAAEMVEDDQEETIVVLSLNSNM